jgi:predicted DNA-binding transcriptional regulator AlpA
LGRQLAEATAVARHNDRPDELFTMFAVTTVAMAQSWILRLQKQKLQNQQSSNPNQEKGPTELLPLLVRAHAIAARTPWTSKHIYDLAKRCRMPHYRIGGSVLFDPVEVKEWFDQHKAA